MAGVNAATAAPGDPGDRDGRPIPLFDLRVTEADIEAVAETLRAGWLTMGGRTAEFEAAFAEHLGCRHAVALSSCTAALHLAYLTAGVEPGDEVIVPSFTFTATAATVVQCGARPVFADITSREQPVIDPDDVARLLTPRTRAVTAVHFAGYPAAVEELAKLCGNAGVALIEDAAHAPSASAGGRKLGTWGLAGAFSFYSNKVLSVGEGGLLSTDSDDVAARARALRSHGMTRTAWDRRDDGALYEISELGFNYRLDDPRAALLLSRLPRLEEDIARRRELVRRYRHELAAVPEVIVPFDDDQIDRSSCYIMPVFLERDDATARDAVRDTMRRAFEVETSVHYAAVHRFAAYECEQRLDRTDLAARTEISLPLYAHLSDAQLDRVVESLVTALADL
jgi:dTDP-4-amino-4,6-dideoxygalactose transaminase